MRELSFRLKRQIKRRQHWEKPTIRIGKGGASEGIVKEIIKQLEKNEVVKIKILKSALEKATAKQLASKIAFTTEATLVEIRGHTFILYKKGEGGDN